MSVRLIAKTVAAKGIPANNAAELIVFITRISTAKTDEEKVQEAEKLIEHCLNHNHVSPFEHNYYSIEITTSRAIGTQLLRHRSFTFQEFSQRYSKVESIESIELRAQATKNRQSSSDVIDPQLKSGILASEEIERLTVQMQDLYSELIDSGVAKECARMILPMATTTKMVMTGNIRSWFFFLKERLSDNAQKEVRQISEAILNILLQECAIVFRRLLPEFAILDKEHSSAKEYNEVIKKLNERLNDIEMEYSILEDVNRTREKELTDLSINNKELRSALGIVTLVFILVIIFATTL